MPTEKLPLISRGRFIHLAAALGATSALVACGGSNDSSDDGSSDSSGDASGTTSGEDTQAAESGGSSGGEAIAAESEVAEGEALEFEDGGDPAFLVHLDGGSFVAFSAICTHQQCTVAYQNGELACPCHGSVFDPSNGAEVTSGPAPEPLPEIPVEVRDGEVFRA